MSKASTRRLWTAIHRYLGLAIIAFLLVAAVTGCVLCFDGPIDAALNPDLFATRAAGPVLSPLETVDRLQRARPDLLVTRFPLQVKAGRTLRANVTARDPAHPLGFDEVFVDPHGARVAGMRKKGPGFDRRHIVEGIYEFHYTLLGGTAGRWLMGIAALGWLVSNGVGIYLTLPVGAPFWRKWRPMWLINTAGRAPALMLDIHRAAGLWLTIGLMVLAFTSVSMNFFDEVFTPIVDAASPARPSPFDRPPAASAASPALLAFPDALAAGTGIARSRGLGWRPAVESYVPERGLYGVMFTRSGFEEYRGLGPVSFYVDGRSPELVYADDPYHDSGGRKLSRALYPLHTGKVAGPVGVAVIFVLGLATAETCVTGLIIWWTKRQARIRSKARAAAR